MCLQIMKTKTTLIVLLFAITATTLAQNNQQAKLLRDAYKENSTEKLYEFFDNWAKEVTSNETEANDPYVAEAHKVFAAFYQPTQMVKHGTRLSMYDDKPYYIVQSSLWKICVADVIPYKREEIDSFWVSRIRELYADDTNKLNRWMEIYLGGSWSDRVPNYSHFDIPPYNTVPTTTVDSAIEFRPQVWFEGKKIVYLTEKYKDLLDSFLGDKHVDLGENNVMQPAYSKGKSRTKQAFFNNAALIYYGHWGGYWQYETYPRASQIIFNPEMNRAVVLFRFVYEGGQVTLEKQKGEWVIVDSRFIWVE